MRCVYHVADETVYTRIDGKMFVIPPNEVTEIEEVRGTDHNNNGSVEYIIPEQLVMRLIIARHPFVVEIPMIKSKGEIKGDLKAAQQAAIGALEMYEDSMLNKYIQEQQDRVMQHGKTPLAPSAPITKILDKRGLDLDKDFNLKVPGLSVSKYRDRDAEIDLLKKQLAQLTEALTDPKRK